MRNGHPWIFSGAIAAVDGDPVPGQLVNVVEASGQFLAVGYYNPASQIRVRLLSWDPNEAVDDEFWRARLQATVSARERLQLEPTTNAYRIANAEADGLPGLIIDKYGEFLVFQCLTTGVERRKEKLIRLAADLLHPTGIVERSDVPARRLENLPQTSGLCYGEPPPDDLVITENGLKFRVDLMKGHKTGFYLDQRENRASVCRVENVSDKEILNVFAYTGGFAVYSAAAGARAITSVDSSADLLMWAEENQALNGFDRPQDEYIAGDAFEVLRHYRDSGRFFDVIFLDPPKFAHKQRDIERASRGYKDLNWLAMRLLRPGGLLATFSCSGRIGADLFQKILFGASIDAGRQVQILHVLGQASDHPILLAFPESAYLKGFLCRVL